jgi:PAS domain-containing protein
LDALLCEALDASPVMIWVSGEDKLCTWFNKTWLAFTGRAMAQELGYGWAEGLHPRIWIAASKNYVSYFDVRKQFRIRYRLRRHDGEYRWNFAI